MTVRHYSHASLKTVSFWQFARAHRYHVHFVKAIVRLLGFVMVIYFAIHTGDYLHTHPLAIAGISLGASKFVDRCLEVMTDVIADRIAPDHG